MASKKQYSSPTYSSNQKSFPPVNMRERIVRLTESVNELKSNVETEAQNQDTLEKSNTKNYAVLNTQIKALRKAFNTLADVIMEELDSIKTEVFRDFQDSNASVYRKIDEISSHVLGIQNEKQENQAQVVALEQDLRERMRILENREDENRQYIQSIAESTKEDQRALYEKFSGLIKNHTAKIDNLTQENEMLQSALSELQRKTNDDTHNINEIYNKIAFVDRVLKEQGEDLVQKFNEARTQTSNLRENLKAELQNVVKGQTDSTRRFEEITLKISERVEANELGADKRYAELEDFVNQVQQEFQENVQELAKIHKDSSTQIIVDFEKAVTSVNNENKVLLKRCTVLESSVSKVREDLGDAITNNERNAGRKNEQLNRAMFDICRQLNITNPLLSY